MGGFGRKRREIPATLQFGALMTCEKYVEQICSTVRCWSNYYSNCRIFRHTHTHFIKAAILGDVTWRWPSTDRSAGWWTLDILLKIWIKPNLVGAIPTPLKNMSSSVGATIPNIWTQMFQTTNQKLFILWKIHSPSWVYWILYVYIMKIPLKKWTNFIIFKPHPGGLCRSPHFFRKLVAIEAMAHHVRWFAVENHLCFFRKHVEPPDFLFGVKQGFLQIVDLPMNQSIDIHTCRTHLHHFCPVSLWSPWLKSGDVPRRTMHSVHSAQCKVTVTAKTQRWRHKETWGRIKTYDTKLGGTNTHHPSMR